MTQVPEHVSAAPSPPTGRSRSWLWKVLLGLIVLVSLAVYFGRETETQAQGATAPVKRGALRITVLEGGTIEARESQDIKCEVRGQTKILSIVEEAYQVTEDDVKNGKVLVELDSADLREKMIQQQIEFESTRASLTEAQEQYEITLKQNESDITAAELDVKFKRIDFEKYLGSELAIALLDKLAIDPTGEKEEDPETLKQRQAVRAQVDFVVLADDPKLQGDAKQKRKKFQTDYLLAQQEYSIAEEELTWTQKLVAKEFETSTKLQQDDMKKQRSDIGRQSAQSAEDLFVKYEFPKDTEKFLSDYEESIRKLVRTKKQAVSKLAQAEARLRAAEGRFQLEERQQKELQEQIDKCTIKATTVGLVVYGGGENRWYGDDQIKEGAMVRERQPIITIPDTTQMSVNVKVHESSIKKVQKGQKATVTLDAFPDKIMEGEVSKVGVLPDSERRWMNPDMKLYSVTVSINGVNEWLKPGMSAEAEILTGELSDVIYVPILAVTDNQGERVCYVPDGFGEPERRVVETGDFNDEYIVIKSGLKEGENVLLLSPAAQDEEGKKNGDKEKEKAEDQQRQKPPAPVNNGGPA